MIERMLITAVILLGAATSYEDAKKGRIRNKYVAAALATGITLNYAETLYSWLTGAGLNPEYWINLAISAAAGYIIWSKKLWSAGDGKLFIAFASLIPLNAYSYWKIPYFPSTTLLLNTFTVLFIALLAKSINKKCLLDALQDAKELGFMFLIKTTATITGIYWLTAVLPINNILARYCITAASTILLQSYLKKSYIYIGTALLALRIIEGLPSGFILQTAEMTAVFAVFKFAGMMIDEIEEENIPFAVYLATGAALTLAGNLIFL